MKELIARVERMTADTRRFLTERAARQIPPHANVMVESVLKVSHENGDAKPAPAPVADATPEGGA